jgi:signal transduction histidine kinase
VPIRVDEKLFLEALSSLINNSIESMPSGGDIILTSRLITNAQNSQQPVALELRITDSGSGISENHIKKIFQPYFTTKKEHKGLGLTVARRIISIHNGSLSIESKKGEGTTVTITIILPD